MTSGDRTGIFVIASFVGFFAGCLLADRVAAKSTTKGMEEAIVRIERGELPEITRQRIEQVRMTRGDEAARQILSDAAASARQHVQSQFQEIGFRGRFRMLWYSYLLFGGAGIWVALGAASAFTGQRSESPQSTTSKTSPES